MGMQRSDYKRAAMALAIQLPDDPTAAQEILNWLLVLTDDEHWDDVPDQEPSADLGGLVVRFRRPSGTG